MTGLAVYLLIVFAAAAVIILVGVIAYNRRLDRIARGEARDAHSSIPEPRTTVGVAYRTVLMVLAVITLLTASAVSGKINSMQNAINNLQSNVSSMSYELSQLKTEQEQRLKLARDMQLEIISYDTEARTAVVRCGVTLRSYSEDTKVLLSMGLRELELQRTSGNLFSCEFTAGWFERFSDPVLQVTRAGVTEAEEADFPEFILWDILPMTGMSSHFSSGVKLGRLTYEGSYLIELYSPEKAEKVKSITVTYLTGNRELRTLDVTEKTMNGVWTQLDKDMDLEGELTMRVDVVTTMGVVISQQTTVMYDTSLMNGSDNFTRITDLEGNLLWQEVDEGWK